MCWAVQRLVNFAITSIAFVFMTTSIVFIQTGTAAAVSLVGYVAIFAISLVNTTHQECIRQHREKYLERNLGLEEQLIQEEDAVAM